MPRRLQGYSNVLLSAPSLNQSSTSIAVPVQRPTLFKDYLSFFPVSLNFKITAFIKRAKKKAFPSNESKIETNCKPIQSPLSTTKPTIWYTRVYPQKAINSPSLSPNPRPSFNTKIPIKNQLSLMPLLSLVCPFFRR